MDDYPTEFSGPKMQALRDDRQRRFAWFMACGELNGRAAALKAGYSDVAEGAKVRASEMMHNPRVLDAIEEASRNVLRSLAPLAIVRARAILDNPKHFAHARMIETVLDRTGHFAKTEHTMRVEHTVDTRELEALALKLAGEAGIDPKRLLGGNGPVIEGEAVEVSRESAANA